MSNLPLNVVTFREVERVLTQTDARRWIEEVAAARAESISSQESLAANGSEELLSEQEEAGTDVMNSVSNAASRLQSLFASGSGGTLCFDPLRTGGEEAAFDTHD